MGSIMMTDRNKYRRSMRRIKKVYENELVKGISPIKVVDDCCVIWRSIGRVHLLLVSHEGITKKGYIHPDP